LIFSGAKMEITALSMMRVTFVVMAASMLALWGWSLVPPIENWNNPNEDGFSYVPVFYATIVCLPTGLFLLAGAIAGRGRHLERAHSALLVSAATLFIVVAFLIFQYVADSMPGLGLS
jgi:heme/copper-type cytochrome/quinol oxidase subunit 3